MSGVEPGDGAQLQMLQQEILEQVLRLTHNPRTIFNALAASKALRLAAAQLIDQIIVHKAGPPPVHTWQTFPSATRVRIHRSRHGNEHLDFLRAILATLPSRITFIEDLEDESAFWNRPSQDASLDFAQALVASACCSSLLSVKLSSGLLTLEVADVILHGLPSLQEARLSINTYQASAAGQHQQVWRPKAQSCQNLVHLDIVSDGPGQLLIDPSGRSAATKLQRLTVSNAKAINVAALQALTNLQHLALSRTDCPAASWAVLAKLPKLDTIKVQHLEIDVSAPAAVVTRLHLHEGLRLLHNAVQLPGCLARQLPQLQHLKTDGWNLDEQAAGMQLAAALQGHQGLKELDAFHMEVPTAAWALLAALPRLEKVQVHSISTDAAAPAAAALSSLQCDALHLRHTAQQVHGCLARQLPQLQHLKMLNAGAMALAAAIAGHQQLQQLYAEHHYQMMVPGAGPDAGWGQNVLAELASCSKLQELELDCTDDMVTAAGCAALAAGACRESLRVVRLQQAVVEPALLAPLLQPGMAALQELMFGLPERYDPAVVQQQVEQVLPAGGGWQWEIHTSRRVYDRSLYCTLSREVAAGLGAACASSG